MTNNSVLQNWLVQIPIRMQSTLILGLRGPDTHRSPEIKKIQRWMRGLAFKPGNPANLSVFMHPTTGVPEILEKSPVAKELEFCSQHFYSHLMHGLQVIGYMHPVPQISNRAVTLYREMCFLMHLPPESRQAFETRLGTIEWPEGQPDTFEDAQDQLKRSRAGKLTTNAPKNGNWLMFQPDAPEAATVQKDEKGNDVA